MTPGQQHNRGAAGPSSDVERTTMAAYAVGPLDASAPRLPAHSTLVQALEHAASVSRDCGIVYDGATSKCFESYADLLLNARRTLSALQQLGFEARQPLVLQISERQAHFHVLWACVLGSIPSVTVAVPSMYDAQNAIFRKVRGVIEQLEVTQVLASSQNVAPLRALLPPHVEVHDVALLSRREQSEREIIEPKVEPEDIVFYQLTSGSTGVPKLVPERHEAIISHIQHSVVQCGYRPEDVTLNWLPFDHVVPMITFHLKDVYVGCTAVQLPTQEVIADPLLWMRAIAAHRVTHSWAPNFGFKLVAHAIEKATGSMTLELSSLKLLMNAGEQVTADVCDDFLRKTRLPSGVMQPAFGMAEVSTCMTYNNHYGPSSKLHVTKASLQTNELCMIPPGDPLPADTLAFVDLGPPSPGVEIRICAADDRRSMLHELQVGRLQIRAPCVMRGYHNHSVANAESFVGDGWFDSGDLGFLHDGRLFLTGRAKEMIILRGVNYYCYEIEDLSSRVDGTMATRIAATSAYNEQVGTEEMLIFFVPDASIRLADIVALHADATLSRSLADLVIKVKANVTEKLSVVPRHVVPVLEENFHRTTSGKIQRGAFKKEYEQGVYATAISGLLKPLAVTVARTALAGVPSPSKDVTAADGVGAEHMGGFDVVKARFQQIAGLAQLMPSSLSAWFIATAWGEFVQRYLLEQLFGEREVFFVQVGANTGANPNDPIYRLVRTRRWKGILVEPQPSVFTKLKENYAGTDGLLFEQAAISDVDNASKCSVELCVPLEAFMEDANCKDTIHYSQFSSIESTRSAIAHAHRKIDVPCLTVQALLAKHHVDSVDLLVTDTEGHDYIILFSIDTWVVKPRVILFEHFYMTRAEYTDLMERLQMCGYAVLWIDSMDSMAVLHATHVELKTLLERSHAATKSSLLMKDILNSETFASLLLARSKEVAALHAHDIHAAVVEYQLVNVGKQHLTRRFEIAGIAAQLGRENLSSSELYEALRLLQIRGVVSMSADGYVELNDTHSSGSAEPTAVDSSAGPSPGTALYALAWMVPPPSRSVAAPLPSQGHSSLFLHLGGSCVADSVRVFEQALKQPSRTGIVLLSNASTISPAASAMSATCALFQQIIAHSPHATWTWTVVTTGVQVPSPLTRDTLRCSVAHAGAWGLVPVARMEEPMANLQLYDVSSQESAITSKLGGSGLVPQLIDTQACMHGGSCLIPRLRRIARTPLADDIQCWPLQHGAYTIVGGLGGLGLKAAPSLLSHGAGSVTLVARGGQVSRKGQGLEGQLSALRLNSSVQILCADASQPCDLVATFGRPQPAGQLYLPHVEGGTRICDMSALQFNMLFCGKAAGAYHMRIAAEVRLGLCISFFASSVASFGGIRSGPYSAANSYIDAFVRSATKQGLGSRSANLPVVRGAGAGAAAFASQLKDAESAPSAIAIGMMDAVNLILSSLRFAVPDVLAPLPADAAMISRGLLGTWVPKPSQPDSGILGELPSVALPPRSNDRGTTSLREDAPVDPQLASLVFAALDSTLEEDDPKHDYTTEAERMRQPFTELGMDSISSVRFIAKLNELLRPKMLPALPTTAVVFTYPSPYDLTKHLEGLRQSSPNVMPTPPATTPGTPDAESHRVQVLLSLLGVTAVIALGVLAARMRHR